MCAKGGYILGPTQSDDMLEASIVFYISELYAGAQLPPSISRDGKQRVCVCARVCMCVCVRECLIEYIVTV